MTDLERTQEKLIEAQRELIEALRRQLAGQQQPVFIPQPVPYISPVPAPYIGDPVPNYPYQNPRIICGGTVSMEVTSCRL